MLARLRIATVCMVTVLYPFAIYFGLSRFEPRSLAWLLLLLAMLRMLGDKGLLWRAAAVCAGLLVVVATLTNAALPLKLYPVLVNALMLILFAGSLWHPPSIIERWQRMKTPVLSDTGVAYTRKVTWVWCVFFVGNGGIALATALWGSDRVWMLYNGSIAYVLMGALYLGEWLLRRRVQMARMA
ncbi:MAG: hypothetical protein COW59_01690 [Lysobacterales bacterium CG17_big_fil_post_rev_8_21_14_2_50_64_11]|nr:MAG: hypothetical protein COW59_01690 [Xanthomonadales bacterium CG17_big_fil_post_rev_8_21_14_2_50_64_11]PIX59389.1 MAG: hypothetical protein COZ47_12730 [Xanthomonadales bacterium CG_4_10_14_3_um_filter_64_11]